MQIDLDEIERLAKAAGVDAGLGTWEATGCVVWFPDGDAVFEAGHSKPKREQRPVGVAFTNIGAWPAPVDEDAVGEFIAAVCPDAVLTLIGRLREMDLAIRTIAEWPVTPAGNMDAENMRKVAIAARNGAKE